MARFWSAVLLLAGSCCCLGDQRENVIVLQDGGVPDDYMGVALLAKADTVELLGDVLVNGDSLLPWSMALSSKIHIAAGIAGSFLGLSNARGFNAFPYNYRGQVRQMANTTALLSVENAVGEPYADGDSWLEERLVSASAGSITIVCTSGLTTLSALLMKNNSLQSKIKRIVWAAGAVDAAGNLDRTIFPGFNNCAEWNVFWDADATNFIFENTTIPVELLPLDISNQANPFEHPEFLSTLGGSSTLLGRIAYESYKLVMVPESRTYLRLWDLLAAGLVSRPNLFSSPRVMRLAIGTNNSRNYGCIYEDPLGREVRVYQSFSGGENGPKRFLDYVAETLAH